MRAPSPRVAARTDTELSIGLWPTELSAVEELGQRNGRLNVRRQQSPAADGIVVKQGCDKRQHPTNSDEWQEDKSSVEITSSQRLASTNVHAEMADESHDDQQQQQGRQDSDQWNKDGKICL